MRSGFAGLLVAKYFFKFQWIDLLIMSTCEDDCHIFLLLPNAYMKFEVAISDAKPCKIVLVLLTSY
jgi:hypothetical protein